MVFGPYDSTFGQGQHTAQFWLMVDNNSGTDVVATVDAVTNYGGNILAQRLIRRNEFVAANQWQVFTLEFNNPCFGLVESRVFWSGTVNMKFSQVSITATSTAALNLEWLVTDHLGTPRMVVNKSGSLAGVKRHDYLPFGEELYAGVSSRTVEHGYTGDAVRQKFTSKERDNETGLDYFLARYYASTQGRFTSPDPLSAPASAHPRIPQSWNLYTYVLNNPLKLVDPDGLMWVYHYLDKEKTKVGIAWIEGNKIPKDLKAQGYQALNFGGASSRDIILTNGSVVRLSANSGNPLQLRGPQEGGGDRAYVNSGLINELGRQTAPIPAATGMFALASVAGGYTVAAAAGLSLANAAGYALLAASQMGENDVQMMGSTSSQYQDTTDPGSIRNIKTDVSNADFIKNMEASGYKQPGAAMRPYLTKGLTGTLFMM